MHEHPWHTLQQQRGSHGLAGAANTPKQQSKAVLTTICTKSKDCTHPLQCLRLGKGVVEIHCADVRTRAWIPSTQLKSDEVPPRNSSTLKMENGDLSRLAEQTSSRLSERHHNHRNSYKGMTAVVDR